MWPTTKITQQLRVQFPIIQAPMAGGATSPQLVAALVLGASGVQMGTAFLGCHESDIHPYYKNKLTHITQDSTILTAAFSGKMARGIRNKFTTLMQSYQDCILDYPIQNALTRNLRKQAEKQNNIDFMSMWAGQSAYLSKSCYAAELMQMLVQDVDELLKTILGKCS